MSRSKLLVGQRLTFGAGTEVIVVRSPPDALVELRCAGTPVVGPDVGDGAPPLHADLDGDALLLGKRYVSERLDIEVLCVRPGPGPIESAGERFVIRAAKPLPASD